MKLISPVKMPSSLQEAWPIFSDWGEVLDEPGPFLTRGNKKGNECEDRSDSPYDSKHRQSPIMLMEDRFCTDRHKMVNEEVNAFLPRVRDCH
jgi:hypothetical protein